MSKIKLNNYEWKVIVNHKEDGEEEGKVEGGDANAALASARKLFSPRRGYVGHRVQRLGLKLDGKKS